MNNVVHTGTNSVSIFKVEDNKGYVLTTFNDKLALDQNSRLRSLAQGTKGRLSLHENEDLRMAISVPSVEQWNLYMRDYPESYELLQSPTESERMKGAKQLQIVHPEWVVFSRL